MREIARIAGLYSKKLEAAEMRLAEFKPSDFDPAQNPSKYECRRAHRAKAVFDYYQRAVLCTGALLLA